MLKNSNQSSNTADAMEFVDLNRNFVALAKGQQPDPEIGRFWGARLGGWLGWEKLKLRRRVILLAEAASGKTEEFRYQSEVIRNAGSLGFFLRIEELADQGTETSLDTESAKQFEAWLMGSGEAWFFLDSVDEARLNRKSFDTALKRFARDLGTGIERAHVFVSCRVTDWKGPDDLATYSRYLPAWKAPITPPESRPNDYSALLDPIFKQKDSRPFANSDEDSDGIRPIRTSNSGITTQVTTILAFAGVGVESANDADWTLKLSEKEAILATRHGCRAEQSYPEWLDQLIMSWPKVVLPIVREEIEREWTSAIEGLSIFLHRYGAAAYNIPQPVQRLILSLILKSDAEIVAILRTGLRIVRNLQLDADERKQLVKTAKKRYVVHLKAKRDDFALSYLGLLLTLNPNSSLTILQSWLNSGPKDSQKRRAETTFSKLFDRHDPILSISLANASTKTLEDLLHLAYVYVRPEDDAVHHGSFSPDARDHAESARNAILSTLLERPGADAYHAMKRLANDSVFELRSHRFQQLTREKAEKDTEGPAWSAAEALTFHREHTAPAKTGADLLRIVMGVLADTARNLTHGDATSRPLLERARDEDEVQNWLVEQMNSRARRRFHAFREAQVAAGDKPDVIVASTSAPYEVAIEVKHGGMGWTARQLQTALRAQLAEDYLKPESRRHGVLVITHHKDRRWRDVTDQRLISFSELITGLAELAKALTENSVGSISVRCVGINAWNDDGISIATKKEEKKLGPSATSSAIARKPSKRSSKKKSPGMR